MVVVPANCMCPATSVGHTACKLYDVLFDALDVVQYPFYLAWRSPAEICRNQSPFTDG